MNTPFSDIYNIFLSQVSMYELLEMSEEALEENMQDWLLGSIGYFTSCKKNLLDYNLNDSIFNVNLTPIEQQILAKIMLYVYINTHVITEQNMKQSLNSRDYRMYSPANQLKALIELRNQINSEINTLISRYSYSPQNIESTWKT